jgi:hypothetical protein
MPTWTYVTSLSLWAVIPYPDGIEVWEKDGIDAVYLCRYTRGSGTRETVDR